MIRISKKIATSFLLISFTLLLRSETVYPIVVLGYIEKLNPLVILVEEISEEVVLPDNQLPVEGDVGMWADIQITQQGYIILRINQVKTTTAKQRSQELHEHLLKRTLK